MESLKELNQICQKPRYREVGNWMVRNILRDAALPITWVLLHTPITANQVTLASFAIGLIGIVFFSFLPPIFFLLGCVLLQVWYLLDHVDGQIARYRKTSCLGGRFFDYLMHHILHMIILFSLGIYCYRMAVNILYIFWGFVAAVSIMAFNLIPDVKYKTFFEWCAAQDQPFQVVSVETAATKEERPSENKHQLLRKWFSVVHKLNEIHVMMNVLTVGALLQVVLGEALDFRFILFFVYGVAGPLIAVVKISYLIVHRKIDEEFRAQIIGDSKI